MSTEVKTSEGQAKPIVLIMGGCGFIGRHLVSYLVKNDLAQRIVVADKSMPITSSLNKEHGAIFERKELVEFKQADLSKDPHVQRVFSAYNYDYVFNVCGETRCGLSEEDYKTKIVGPAEKCGLAVSKQPSLKKWIEVSTAHVYPPDDSPSNEDNNKLKPWTIQAKYRLEAENVLRALGDSFPLVILRPSIVYGIGDLTGFTPRISCCASYTAKKEKIKFLWDKTLKVNCVHVDDMVRAAWLSALHAKPGAIFNLSDAANLDQGTLNAWLGAMFNVEVGYVGTIMSNMAKVMLQTVADQANDDHVPAFTALCAHHNILNTPISPYIDKELLYNNHLCVDGRRITKDLPQFGDYQHKVSQDLIKQQVVSFIEQGIFPPVLA